MTLDFPKLLLWAGIFVMVTSIANGSPTLTNTSSPMAPFEPSFSIRRKRMTPSEAATAAEKSFAVAEKTANTLYGMYDVRDAMKIGKVIGETLGPLSSMLGPAFGAIGALFSIISLLLPKFESDELIAIKAGFKEMHTRFDKLESQITALDSKYDFYTAIVPYKEVREDLRIMNLTYRTLSSTPEDIENKKQFKNACAVTDIEPLQALDRLRKLVVNPDPQDVPHLIPTIISYFKLEYKVILPWFQKIVFEAFMLASLRSACYGIRMEVENKAGILNDAKKTAVLVHDIIKKLAEYETKVADLDPAYHVFLKNGMTTAVQSAPSEDFAQAYPTEKGICTNHNGGEHHDPWYRWQCKGAKELVKTRYAIETYLNKKYEWLTWFVFVHKNSESDADSPCVDAEPGHFITLKNGDDKIFVTWSRKDPLIKRVIEKVRPNFLNALKQSLTEKDGFLVLINRGQYSMHMNYIMKKFQKSGLAFYDNMLVCNFGGDGKEYQRAISREHIHFEQTDIATWKTEPYGMYTFDLVLTYYADNKENTTGCQTTDEELKQWGLKRDDYCAFDAQVSIKAKKAQQEWSASKKLESLLQYYRKSLGDEFKSNFAIFEGRDCYKNDAEKTCLFSAGGGSPSSSYTNVKDLNLTVAWSVGDFAFSDLQYQMYTKEGRDFFSELVNLPKNPILTKFKKTGDVKDIYNFFADPENYYRNNKVPLTPSQISKLNKHFIYENRFISIYKLSKEQMKSGLNCDAFQKEHVAISENQLFKYNIKDSQDLTACVFIAYYKPKGMQDSFPCKFTKAEMTELIYENDYEGSNKIADFKREEYRCPFDPDFDPYDAKIESKLSDWNEL